MKVLQTGILSIAVSAWLTLWPVSPVQSQQSQESPESDTRPNIIFILCDDLGWGDLTCYGHQSVLAHGGWTVRGTLKTPNIDRMAAEGTLFTQFYVASAVCSPSRAAIMTGQYPARLRIHDYLASSALNAERGMPDFLDPAVPTLPRLLQQAGYATGHFGKWHLGGRQNPPPPSAYGIDRYSSCLGADYGPDARVRSTEHIIDETIRFVEDHQNQPFYINTWLYDPHSPLRPTEEMMAPYRELNPRWEGHVGALQIWYAVISDIDRHVGRLLQRLEELGIGDNTLVIFTSDNGPTDWPKKYLTGPPAGFTGPYRGRKWSLFEGGIRMPFIARWTGTIPAGIEDTTSVVSAIDLSPTICRFAGVSVEDDLDGLDRGDVLLGNASRRAKPVFWQYGHPHAILKGGKPEHQSPTFAMRDGRWKFLINPDGSEAQLFDLDADEGEATNLLLKQPERATAMANQISAWADNLGFAFDKKAPLTAPGPTIAILASNQLLRFVNHGVKGDTALLRLDGKSWLDLPAFRVPKVAGGRSLQIKGTIRPSSPSGVILAHGGNRAGYSVYLNEGHLCFATCADKKRTVVRSSVAITGSTNFEARWNPNGEMFLKVNGKLVGKAEAGIIRHEPGDSIQIGADLIQPVGNYNVPNHFSGIIENLTFKYPNGK
ncbi:MAG: sulfatase-like hydrolase/transferase [Planctomycetes bacterium]|nr:sulfatase-like hydrolase/transferase [Planctomycetota bacterium]